VQNVKIILLSGGSGTRLWPLSNDARSKQFLKVLPHHPQAESMIQRVWRQLKQVDLSASTLISTNATQTDAIRSQLEEQIPLIIEPQRRNTFPAIALAVAYFHSVLHLHPTEVICVLPIDAYVEDLFFHKIKQLESVVGESHCDLALIGVKPTYPSAKYGYIVPASLRTPSATNYIAVNRFVEKPTEESAQKLIKEDALWNCGVFAFQLHYLLSLLSAKGFPLDYHKLEERYDQLPEISFDYEIVEKARQRVVIPYDGDWSDLGTWNTLTEKMDTSLLGKGVIDPDAENTHLVNELNIPVIIAGLSDIVVAASPDGIMVTDKLTSTKPEIKEMVQRVKQRAMYEERRWGWYRVLDHFQLSDETEVLVKRIGVLAGKNLSYQTHQRRSEVWTIIRGEGEFALQDQLHRVQAGDVLTIPVGSKHGIQALTELEFIEVQRGKPLEEKDIVRLFMDWEEVQKYCCKTPFP
jgi:mannose-1-phosphate guanylyltransferase